MHLSFLKIGTRLGLAFGLLVLMMLGITGVGLLRLAEVQPRQQQTQAHQATTDEGDDRQHDRPARRQQQVAEDVPEREVDHRLSAQQRPCARRSSAARPS